MKTGNGRRTRRGECGDCVFSTTSLERGWRARWAIPIIRTDVKEEVNRMDTIRIQRDGVIKTYTLLERLGSGSFSQVYKCKTVVDGKEQIYVTSLRCCDDVGSEGLQQVLP